MNREVAANNHCQIGKKWLFIFVLQKKKRSIFLFWR
jgi:hypothetical protein